MDQENKTSKPKENIQIIYNPAKFIHRLLADLIDILLMILVGSMVFIGIRSILDKTPDYSEAASRVKTTKVDSGLYLDVSGEIIEIVTYFSNSKDVSAGDIKIRYRKSIDQFIDFIDVNGKPGSRKEVQDSYDKYRLDSALAYEGQTYFISDSSSTIKENPDCTASDKNYAENVYANYIENYALGFLSTLDTQYVKDNQFLSRVLLLGILPGSIFISSLLVLFVPPLFFKRGRKTLGKALYHIGRVDSDCFSLGLGKFCGESAILILAIIMLSYFTLGIPILISFSLMAFSKKKQDFADYMLGIREIDGSKEKIYFSKEEVLIDGIDNYKKAVDFVPDDLSDK